MRCQSRDNPEKPALALPELSKVSRRPLIVRKSRDFVDPGLEALFVTKLLPSCYTGVTLRVHNGGVKRSGAPLLSLPSP